MPLRGSGHTTPMQRKTGGIASGSSSPITSSCSGVCWWPGTRAASSAMATGHLWIRTTDAHYSPDAFSCRQRTGGNGAFEVYQTGHAGYNMNTSTLAQIARLKLLVGFLGEQSQ